MRIGSLALAIGLLGCGSGIAPEPDPAAQLWAEACARVSGCEPFLSTLDPLFACQAVRDHFSGTGPAECALAAADCDAAVACFGNGAPPIVCPVGEGPRCEGEVLVECDVGVQLQIARDCAADGLTCRPDEFGRPRCAREGECTAGACDGDVPIQCLRGIPVPQDCGRGRCVVVDGFATCTGEGEPCDAPLARCDGDVAVSCREGFVHREQCPPGACSTRNRAFCRESLDCRERCEGSSVVFCVEGRVERYDCREWGFTECAEHAASRSAFCR